MPGDHWTTRCPYKDTLAPISDANDPDKKTEDGAAPGGAPGAAPTAKTAGGKYVPPSMRDGGNKRGESMSANSRGKWKSPNSSEVEYVPNCLNIGHGCGVIKP